MIWQFHGVPTKQFSESVIGGLDWWLEIVNPKLLSDHAGGPSLPSKPIKLSYPGDAANALGAEPIGPADTKQERRRRARQSQENNDEARGGGGGGGGEEEEDT